MHWQHDAHKANHEFHIVCPKKAQDQAEEAAKEMAEHQAAVVVLAQATSNKPIASTTKTRNSRQEVTAKSIDTMREDVERAEKAAGDEFEDNRSKTLAACLYKAASNAHLKKKGTNMTRDLEACMQFSCYNACCFVDIIQKVFSIAMGFDEEGEQLSTVLQKFQQKSTQKGLREQLAKCITKALMRKYNLSD